MSRREDTAHSAPRDSYRRSLPLRLVVGVLVLSLACATVACDSRNEPPASWEEVNLDEQPPLLEKRNGHPALAELEEFYLGQSRDAAKNALDSLCEETVRRDSGSLGGDAYFLGCRIEDHPVLEFVRIGFWPKLDERVATLEIKRNPVPPAAVYGRFQQVFQQGFDESPDDMTLLQQAIQIETPNYRFFADWDEGLDGPTHLVVGFAPDIPLERVEGGG